MLLCFPLIMLPAGVIAMLIGLAAVMNQRRRERPQERNECGRCGYSLAGMPARGERICPECGEDAWGRAPVATESVGWGWWAAVGAIALGGAAALISATGRAKWIDYQVLMVLASLAASAGVLTQVMALAMTDRVRRGPRAALLGLLGVVQTGACICWIAWQVRLVADMG